VRLLGIWILNVISWCAFAAQDAAIDVYPGQDIQEAVERAAQSPSNKVVKVHAGIYPPRRKGQAMIFLNQRHDGVHLEGVGEVTLSAQNPDIADKDAPSFPAVVNHVVYFGDGISSNTLLRGFKITGANNFVTDQPSADAIEPNLAVFDKAGGAYGRIFFFTDGGAIKIFGRSFPTIENVEIFDCFSNPCAGGVSIEHRGHGTNTVKLTNCIFRNNRALVTGSAVDLLTGSGAEIRNCLFVGNISNTGTNYTPIKGNIPWPDPRVMATTFGYMKAHGSGALTVFSGSIARVDHCTFTGNFNGVDDRGAGSSYADCIFWKNNATGGIRPSGRYELDVLRATVSGCFIHGDLNDVQGRISSEQNHFDCPDPDFDAAFTPRNPAFKAAGYRRSP
jgi:hypothetical protein